MSRPRPPEGEGNGSFTRWALGVLAAGAIAAVSFAWGEISTIGKDVAAIKADMGHVKEALRGLGTDRYYRREAEKDLAAMGRRIEGLEGRLGRIESNPSTLR